MFSAPNHVNFLLTHQCNFMCNYCYVPFQSYSKELGMEQVIEIINLLYERGVFSLDLTGGEPLLREDITEILKYCNDLDIDVGLATNGVLLTKERIDTLAKVWDRKRTVHVSMDASTPEGFFQITGSKDFFKILDCTRALLEYDLDIIWNFVYTAGNKEDLIPVCKLASNLGVSKMFVLPVIQVGRALTSQLSFKELQTFLLRFPEIEKQYPSIKFRVSPATPLDFIVPLFEAEWDIQKVLKYYPYARTPLQDDKFKEIRSIGCIGGVGRWAVNAQGNVFPCELLTTDNRMKCGNLLEDPFGKCLDLCSSVMDVKLEEIGNCKSCKYAEICGGGCRARAFMRYGSFYAPDPLCPFYSFDRTYTEKRIERYDKTKNKIQEFNWKAFSVKIGDTILRVRREVFGGTVYVPGHEQQIYLNKDGYAIFEIFQRTQDRYEVIRELKRRKISIDEKSVCDFLDQSLETFT